MIYLVSVGRCLYHQRIYGVSQIMAKRKLYPVTARIPAALLGSINKMAKNNEMSRGQVIEKVLWLGHGCLAADSCIDDIGELKRATHTCEQEGGAVDENLIAHANSVISESLHVLDSMAGRGSASLHGVLKVLIEVTGKATAINEARWIEGAVESAEKMQ